MLMVHKPLRVEIDNISHHFDNKLIRNSNCSVDILTKLRICACSICNSFVMVDGLKEIQLCIHWFT